MSPKNIDRILVIELWNIGDVILAMPFLAALRAQFPEAKITLLARPFASDLLAGTGLVDEFVYADLSWGYGVRANVMHRIAGVWSASRQLRRRRFDLAFSARHHLREHLILALSRAEKRIGLGPARIFGALTDRVNASNPRRHRSEEWLSLLKPLDAASKSVLVSPGLRVSDTERAWARDFLAMTGISDDDIVIGIHPGASLPQKRWPLDRFRELAIRLASRGDIRLLAFAEPPPSNYGIEMFDVPGVVGAQTTLRQLIALISRCDLLVCNDSGPMHIAAALSVPTVAMFGSGIEEWFAPLGEAHQLLRAESGAVGSAESPAMERGVRTPIGIGVAKVEDAVTRALQRLGKRNRFLTT